MTPTIEEVAGWLREAGAAFHTLGGVMRFHLDPQRRIEIKKRWNARASQVEAMGWRPIEDAQRSIEDRCLLCNGITVVIGYWDGSRWVNERSPFRSTCPATHFMPLPQPPVSK